MLWRLFSVLVIFGVFGKCDQTFSDQEAELLSYLEKIENTQTISLVGDYVVLEKSNNGIAKNQNDLLERCASFIASRELKIKFSKNEARDFLTGK